MDEFDQAAAQVMGGPWDTAASSVVDDQRTQLRASLYSTLLENPDEAARAKNLGQRAGLPRDVVQRNMPQVERTLRMGEFDEVLSNSPTLGRWLAEQDNAAIAHDDSGSLTAIEKAVRSSWQFTRSVAAGAQGMPADLVYGGGRALFETVAPIMDPLAGTILPENPLRRVAGGFADLQRDAQGVSRRIQGDISGLGSIEGAINQGGRSLGGNIVTLPLALAGGGPAVMLTPLVGSEFGRSYGDARDKGLGQFESLAFGSSQAAIEYATEKLPVSRLLGDMKAGTGFAKMLGRQVTAEVPGEQLATVLQDLNEWAALNPDKSLRSFVDNYADPRVRGEAALQTLIATVVGVGGMTTTVKAMDTVARRFSAEEGKARAAVEDAGGIQSMVDLATASKLRQRDPGGFEQFVKQATADGGQVQDLFIQAETLAQEMGPNLQALTDAVPALREQIDEALETGGVVAIPIEQLMAYVPADQARLLVPHLRTAPDAMSLAEAQAFDQDGMPELQAEMEAAVAEPIAQIAGAMEQVGAVRESIMGQLQATGRFTGDVNQAYGDLLTRFFEATAERSGMDVGTLFQEFGPRIVSQLGRAPEQLDQTEQTDHLESDSTPNGLNQERRGAFARDMFEVFDQAGKPLGFVQATDRQTAQEAATTRYPGAARVSERSTAVLALLSQADLSTLIHEAGHYFLEVHAELAMRPDVPVSFREDMQTVLDWFGVPELATWKGMSLEEKRPYHEQFARGWEAFAFEGAAPSQELQGVFQRFRGWLLRVYKTLAALRVELSPEVREVFGRMVATEEQIAEAEAIRGYRPLFESAEAAGMSADEWTEYQATGAQATAEAVENLERRSLRDMQWLAGARSRALKRLQRQTNEWRKAVREEVTAEVNALPIYAAWRDLARGQTAEGQPVRLSLPELKAMHPELVDKIPANMATNDGMLLDMVAEAYGMDSGDHLVKLLSSLDHPDQVIDEQIDQRMLERYGDLTDATTIERAADELIHNEARARFLEREVNALGKAVGNRPIVTRAARQYAEEAIARKKVREIRPAQFSAAEARAARAAAQAFKKGDTTTAAVRKREQLLQNQLAKVSHRAVGEIGRAIDYLSRFDTGATRSAVGPEYAEQIDQLLERFDLRKSTTLKAISRRRSLSDWVESQREQGLEPNIDEALLTDAAQVSYKEMTLEDLRGLVDTVKNIEHLGRLKQKLLTVQDQRRFDEIVTEVAQSITDNGGQALPVELEGRQGLVPWLQGVWAAHRKISSLVRQMDGGKDAGPLWRVLVRGMNDAGNREQVMTEQATMKLAELYAPMLEMPGGLAGGRVRIAEIGASLSRGGRLAVALNWGNSANRQRLLDGEGWTPGQVGAILRTLNPQELAFVNGVWEFLDSYWPETEAKQMRVDGIKPEKVHAEPFVLVTADGTPVQMRGGYYPIKYDADRSSRAESQEAAEVAKDMMRGAFTRATTRRGHTKARAEVVKRPVRKDLDVITQHITQVTHDLAWHEWLIDASRLLSSKPVDAAIRTHYGPDIVRTLKDDIAGIATGDLAAQNAITRALNLVRANVTRSTMGLSFTTALLQPFGLTQSMARIGVKPVLRGVARWAGDAARFESSMAWISDKSDFMRLRSKTFNRELSEIRGKVAGQSSLAQVRDGVLFALMQKMQLVADVPTWIGQYEKALAEGRDDATAVALADQAVIDAQGGGQTKDLAQVQRDHPFLTQFYSYFSTTLNLVAESTARTNFRNPLAVAGWLGDMALLIVIPAIAPMLVLMALRGDDDDDLLQKMAQAQAGYLLGMVVLAREFSGAVSGYPYSGPPVGRVVTDGYKVIDQASQGEIDEPAVMALVRVLGTAFGIPITQAVRSYRGWEAWSEGDAPATSILFGPPANE
ncbi:MAG: hypothetical protein Q8L16_26885 [Hydrogenophaga sp.]|nr:hypothetical protein [Hydrogenophaga sp.]